MANIEFDGFVEDVLMGRNGAYGVKVSEPHRRKDGDEWVTVARTFHRVTGAWQANIPWESFAKGDRVSVSGKQVTDPYTAQDGQKKYPLVVKAETVTRSDGRQSQPQESSDWATAQPGGSGGSQEVPF